MFVTMMMRLKNARSLVNNGICYIINNRVLTIRIALVIRTQLGFYYLFLADFNENLPGPQVNISEESVIHENWKRCFEDKYDGAAKLDTIKKKCQKSKIMMACKEKGEKNIKLLAWAPREKVFQDTSSNPATGHVARAISWYLSEKVSNSTRGSWGFTGANDAISWINPYNPTSPYRCDLNGINNPNSVQLCWNLVEMDGVTYMDSGFRCGNKDEDQERFQDSNWERIIFQKD